MFTIDFLHALLMGHKHDLIHRYTIHVIYAYIMIHPYITQTAHIIIVYNTTNNMYNILHGKCTYICHVIDALCDINYAISTVCQIFVQRGFHRKFAEND